MIDELGPEAKALLAAARDGLSPEPAAVRRVRAGISAATGAAAGTPIAAKLVVALVAAVAGGAVVYAVHRATRTQVVAPRVELASAAELRATVRETAPASATTSAANAGTSTTRAASAPTGATASATSIASDARANPSARAPASASTMIDDELIVIEKPAAPAPRPARSASERATAPPASPPVSAAQRAQVTPTTSADRSESRGLAREVELLDLAMVALRRGDAGAALAAVRRHAAETSGRGQLAEDAAAIEIEALCRLHDPTTHGKLEAFDARFPRSAQRSRLTTVCP